MKGWIVELYCIWYKGYNYVVPHLLPNCSVMLKIFHYNHMHYNHMQYYYTTAMDDLASCFTHPRNAGTPNLDQQTLEWRGLSRKIHRYRTGPIHISCHLFRLVIDISPKLYLPNFIGCHWLQLRFTSFHSLASCWCTLGFLVHKRRCQFSSLVFWHSLPYTSCRRNQYKKLSLLIWEQWVPCH